MIVTIIQDRVKERKDTKEIPASKSEVLKRGHRQSMKDTMSERPDDKISEYA